MAYFLPAESVKQAFKALVLFPELIYAYKAKVSTWLIENNHATQYKPKGKQARSEFAAELILNLKKK